MIGVLNQHLAAALDRYSQAKQAHWNVKGPSFLSLHELFDKVAEELRASLTKSRSARLHLAGSHLGP